MKALSYFILFLAFINLIRLTLFMVSADRYETKARRRKLAKSPYQPLISVVIPAYNEEVCIVRTVKSAIANDYRNKEIIVVVNNSTDRTYSRLRAFKRRYNVANLTVVNQKAQGKALAVNNGVKKYAKGKLIMVLDADSQLAPDAISRMVDYFRDRQVVAAAANVKVIDGWRLLTIAQRLEYVVSHRMKRALTTLNMEYIIGGVGSTFRRSIIEKCEYYDTDTLTEDIDFTMKIINRKGNRKNKIVFAADVLAYTEGVVRFSSLVRQRFRWKFGRMQTFVKNRSVFFSRQSKHSKKLAWVYLPFVVFSELLLLLDPFLTLYVLITTLLYAGIGGFLAVYLFVTLFSSINILAEPTETFKAKLRLILIALFSYGLLMMMSFVDFLALMKSLKRFPELFRGKGGIGHWEKPERTGIQLSA